MKTYLVLECHPGFAVLIDEEGRFVKACNFNYSVGQTVEDIVLMHDEQKEHVSFFTPGIAIGAVAVAGAAFFFAFNWYSNSIAIYSHVYLSINPDVAMISVALVTIFKGIGYYMMIYLSALMGIPKELYEAAEIDGASGFAYIISRAASSDGQIAQLVEQRTENPRVEGSTPPLATIREQTEPSPWAVRFFVARTCCGRTSPPTVLKSLRDPHLAPRPPPCADGLLADSRTGARRYAVHHRTDRFSLRVEPFPMQPIPISRPGKVGAGPALESRVGAGT